MGQAAPSGERTDHEATEQGSTPAPDPTDLQALIAEAIHEAGLPMHLPCPPAVLAAAVMAAVRDPGNRERVLTEIGMEQVGWRVRDDGPVSTRGAFRHYEDSTCDPVYAPLPVTEGSET